MTQKWTARIVSDGNALDTATGDTAEDAILSLVTEITDLWRDGEYVLDSGFFQEIADVLKLVENTLEEQDRYSMPCGDMIDPWFIEIVRS